MPDSVCDVLIVGAGPTGLTLAIELHRLGLSTRLIDKAPHGAKWSQALVVQARTLEQWERYGIADTAVAHGRKVRVGRLISHGETVVELHLDRIPGKYPFLLFYPQCESEQLLRDHLATIDGPPIERQTELLSFSQDTSGIDAILRLPDGSESSVRASWLLGADGAHSAVRDRLDIPFSGSSVNLSFLLGDLVIEGPDDPGDTLVVHLKEGSVVFLSRISDRICRMIYASHTDASFGSSGENSPAPSALASTSAPTLDDFNQAFARVGVQLRATAADWSTPFHVNDRQAALYRVGRALIAGDASHIHSPVGGQGMNTGVQDAANLAWKLAAVHRGAPDALLDTYEAERSAVGRALLDRTGRGLELGTTTNPVVRWLRDFAGHELTRLTSVQDAAAGFLSETAIHYRASNLSEDHGGTGSLHAGDRVPNPQLGSGPFLLDHLATGRSLLLVVNTPAPPADVPADAAHLAVLALDTGGDPALASLFGSRPAFLLVRPDGYLGFRAPADKSASLRTYLHRIGAL